jgi:thiol-disulfide isomerase/thioredoxin
MMLYRLSAILLVMLLVSPCAAGATAPDLADKFRTEQAGQPLPAIIFKDGSGREQRLANYAGRPILLNLWATWCVPCVKEMPSLDALQQLAGPENLLVLALAQDRQGDSKVPAFYQRYGIKNLGVYVDPTGQTMFTLKLRGLPTSILLDHQGQEIGRIEGEVDWSSPTTLAFLERLTGLKLASANH